MISGGLHGRNFGLAETDARLPTYFAEAVTDYWFDVLKFPTLSVPKAVANVASRRISEKQAMRVIATKERDHLSGRLRDEIWEISSDEWRARRRIATT